MFADVHKKCGDRWKIVRELRWFCAAHFLLCFFLLLFLQKTHETTVYVYNTACICLRDWNKFWMAGKMCVSVQAYKQLHTCTHTTEANAQTGFIRPNLCVRISVLVDGIRLTTDLKNPIGQEAFQRMRVYDCAWAQ